MEHKTVWMVSGNKGGVGKSLFCLALASALDMLGERYAVLDGDGRTGDVYAAFTRKCPARLGDFRELRPESHMCSFDKTYEDMLHQLLRSSPHLIVNTPDGADNILAKWFDVTLQHTESNNYQFKLVYLMSDRPDGLDMLNELSKRFRFLYPVRNLHFGDESLFSVFNQDFAHRFTSVLNFPVLRGEEVRLLFNDKTSPIESVNQMNPDTNSFTLPMLSRARLLAWQNKVNDEIWEMIDNKDVSTLVVKKW